MATKPRVAVLLAVHNGEDWLSKQIDTIFDQNSVEITIYASLDDCTDDSIVICQEYEKRRENFRILNDKEVFGNACRNFYYLLLNVDFSRYSYIALADQDDIWLPEKLNRAICSMEKHSCEAYSSDLTAFMQDTGEEWRISKSGILKNYDYLFQGASAGCTYVFSSCAIAKICEQLSKPEIVELKRPSHDWTLYAICRSNKVQWFFDPKSYIKHRLHGGNFYGRKKGFRAISQKIKLARAGWYRMQILYLENYIICTDNEIEIIKRVRNNDYWSKFWLGLKVFQFRRRKSEVLGLLIIILFMR